MENFDEKEPIITIDDPNLIDVPIENIEISFMADYIDTK